MSGEVWTAIKADPDGHYEPTKVRLMSLTRRERNEEEVRLMDELQGEEKGWKRYYAISTEWVTKWL